jgi:hypothetical protein
MLGGSPLAASQTLSSESPAHERYSAAATLAVSLVRGDGSFERLTRIEQRLERSIYRNLNELRKLRKTEDDVASLSPPLRSCPFLAEAPEDELAEDEGGEEVTTPPAREDVIVQNEPMRLPPMPLALVRFGSSTPRHLGVPRLHWLKTSATRELREGSR